MSGHVFVTQGDLTRLDCDAWLLPTDESLSVEPWWLESLDAQVRDAIGVAASAGADVGGARVRRVDVSGVPVPYLTDVGTGGPHDPQWYADGATEFLDTAARDLGEPRHGRAMPLVGLPVVGTGEGGAGPIRGSVLQSLLDELHSWTARHDVDVVLVVPDRRLFTAAQAVRRRRNGRASEIPAHLHQELDRLAAFARTGELVLFLGAGVSTAAGLPDWRTLLRELTDEAGVGDDVAGAMHRLDALDQARLIAGRLQERGQSIGAVVAERYRCAHYALPHALCASMPVHEVATLNWDTLFEAASRDTGRLTAVLPYEPAVGADRWVLKLHGTIDEPDDVVLTREDYLRLPERHGALAGIVQALLVTRHMLFVGFGLTDDHFHGMVHDVRAALRRDRSAMQPFGTALVLHPDPLLEELWTPELDFVAVWRDAATDDDDVTAQARRRSEIVLDELLCRATTAAEYLLDPSFEDLLTDAERKVVGALEQVADVVRSADQTGDVVIARWAALLAEHGWRANHEDGA